MTTYTLTATLDNETDIEEIEASTDGDAMIHASFVIMDNAYNNNLWSRGAISLVTNGRIVATMDEKEMP